MTAVVVVLAVVVVAALAYNAYRRRPEHTIESGISSFRREMRALAPRGRRSDPTDRPAPERRPEDERIEDA